MKFTIEINCENAAFGETLGDNAAEVNRILTEAVARNLAGKAAYDALPRVPSEWPLFDANGNRVGFLRAQG